MAQVEDLKEVEISVLRKVLVVGAGSTSKALVRELISMGHDVIVVNPKGLPGPSDSLALLADDVDIPMQRLPQGKKVNERVEVMAPAEIVEFDGSPGRFYVRIQVKEREDREEEVGAVVLAMDCEQVPTFGSWGLKESERIISLSGFEEALKSLKDISFLKKGSPLTCLMLCGFTHDSHPFSQKRAIEASLELIAEGEHRAICLTDDFKVSAPGMERLNLEAREAGVLFVRLTGERPKIECRSGLCTVSFYDESLGRSVTLTPDILVLEEASRPAESTAQLSEKLGIYLDHHGFFQGDNVYNFPIFTNRTGIFVIGSSKGPASLEQGIQEAKAAALEVNTLLGEGKQRIRENRVQLDRKKCTICLTCHRLCPHRAVSYLNRRPEFSDLACRTCGICAAECPMDAIQIQGYADTYLKSQIQDMGGISSILIFCCQNSAYEAANLAAMSGHPIPNEMKLIKVPCAGKVDSDYLLSAFRSGADGVMVLACHHESCKSVQGSQMAQWRVEALHGTLEESGLEGERLLFRCVAPGMPSNFLNAVSEMKDTILRLGASPIQFSKGTKSA